MSHTRVHSQNWRIQEIFRRIESFQRLSKAFQWKVNIKTIAKYCQAHREKKPKRFFCSKCIRPRRFHFRWTGVFPIIESKQRINRIEARCVSVLPWSTCLPIEAKQKCFEIETYRSHINNADDKILLCVFNLYSKCSSQKFISLSPLPPL